ncbi:hypothetical protein RI129_005415 [Pyrocoelia pectoralis]|uniref:N-acetyltransferase domain-containing protein n=1 Tax=Pyrocoelia pectoralis TaxID=417401 RepID=A0AAN7VKU6_9COLE
MVIIKKKWTRPEAVAFPRVWRSFKGRKEINGAIPSFWVQDIPEDEFENVINCMVEDFCKDEPVTKCSGFIGDHESVECRKKLWSTILPERMGLICYMENPKPGEKPIFAAVNCTHARSKYDEKFKATGEVMSDFAHIRELITQGRDPYQFLDTDVLLCSLGIYVLPQFRGQDLGLQLLLAREDLCNACGIKAAVTVFTSSISQALAYKAGYKTFAEISYQDLKDIYKYDYTKIGESHKSMKYMYKIF